MEESEKMNICRKEAEEELDDIVLEYLETLENYLCSALDEEKLLKEGFINIAYARMNMKPYLLTLEGFPSDLTKDASASATVNVRKEEGDTNPPDRQLHMDSSRDLECRRLFGRSTPANLKSAQTVFQRVLERNVERANILSRLHYLEDRKQRLELQLRNMSDNKENFPISVEAEA